MITRRHLLAAAAAGAAATPPIAARAQPAAWRPNRSIRLVLGFAPGGVGDLTARLVAPKMSEMLGQTIVIDNRPSAGGIVAGEAVARAQPDGHTLLLLTTTNSTACTVKCIFIKLCNFFMQATYPFLCKCRFQTDKAIAIQTAHNVSRRKM